jgi:methylated-DNA-protein-cysteine methyltransferase-like protein
MSFQKLDFYEKVYLVVKKIPFGRVTSYGAIAKYIGSPQSARVVGWAMKASHQKSNIPAHRVLNRIGLLTGKHNFYGTNLMKQLLENEGLKVVKNKVVDFELYYWDPKEYITEI